MPTNLQYSSTFYPKVVATFGFCGVSCGKIRPPFWNLSGAYEALKGVLNLIPAKNRAKNNTAFTENNSIK